MAQRVLVRLVTQLAHERGITVHALSHGWILLLQKNGTVRRIFGYDFDLNDAVAQMLAKDKSATALLLQFHNVPAVEHHLFLRSDIEGYTSERGNWAALQALAEAYAYQLVCKPNAGTSGQDVHRVRSPRELEWVVHRLFQEYKAIAVAPYYEIPHEYRVILLDGEVLLMYEKRRPTITGDGRPARCRCWKFPRGCAPAWSTWPGGPCRSWASGWPRWTSSKPRTACGCWKSTPAS